QPRVTREHAIAARSGAIARRAAADRSVPHQGAAGADSGAEEILKKLSAFTYQLSAFFLLISSFSGCNVEERSNNKLRAIIGAVLIDGNGGPPITDSVVLISGSRIPAAGLRANVPIPSEADKVNGSGKF